MKGLMIEKNPFFLQCYKVKNHFKCDHYHITVYDSSPILAFCSLWSNNYEYIVLLFFYNFNWPHRLPHTIFYLFFSKFTVAWILSIYSTLLNLPPSGSTVKKNAGIEPRTIATLALPTRQDLIHPPQTEDIYWDYDKRRRHFLLKQLLLQPTENPYFYCCRLCAGASATAALIRQNSAPTSPLSAVQDAAASGSYHCKRLQFKQSHMFKPTRFLNRLFTELITIIWWCLFDFAFEELLVFVSAPYIVYTMDE